MLAYVGRYSYWALGGYREYREVCWAEVRRLVFVCRGNICRSAYAEYWAKAQGLSATSVGVETSRGHHANAMALKVAEHRNVQMGDHRTTPIEDFEAKDSDLFVAMEPWHVTAIKRQQHWTATRQITLLGLWIGAHGAVLSDPYEQDELTFGACFSLIAAGILGMKGRIAKE